MKTMRTPTKSFKSFIKEETIQTYFLQINPYSDEEEVATSVSEMAAMSLWHSSRGLGVLITVRPIEVNPE
jgi:hypothetical protein